MTYKEFREWCNDRVYDGMWSFDMAIRCIDMLYTMKHAPFWKRKAVWTTLEPLAVRVVKLHNEHYGVGAKMDGDAE